MSRPVTDDERRRFMHSTVTQTVLYPDQFWGGQPPERVVYLADEVTGMLQHTYELRTDMAPPGTEHVNWAQQGPADRRNREGEEANWRRTTFG
jgi:hypothetical protein